MRNTIFNRALQYCFAFTLVVLGVALLATSGHAQTAGNAPIKDDLFVGTEVFQKNATSVTEVTLDPDSLRQVDGRDASKARNTLLSVVRTYSYDKPGMFSMDEVEKYRAKLNTGDWHCSVHTRELKSGSSTDVCSKTRTDDYKESAIISVSPTSLTFIHSIKRRDLHSGGGGESFVVMPSFSGAEMASLSAEQMDEVHRAMLALQHIDVSGVHVDMHNGLGSVAVFGKAIPEAATADKVKP